MSRYPDEPVNRYPNWSPRFWAGMSLPDVLRLLMAGRFRIHPLRYGMTFMVLLCATVSGVLGVVQSVFRRRAIAATAIEAPVFVIGHWRSGTTLLHELLALDPRFTYPTTFQCFLPTNFLVSERFLQPLVEFLLPRKRPMDNMPSGAEYPQEDEFALLAMGAATPYRYLAFCNEPPPWLELLNLDGARTRDVKRIRACLTRFYKSVVCHTPGRLVVKSPTHTGRIAALAEWFPGARFIHISRHPYKVFPSTVNLWKSLATVQGFQLPPADPGSIEAYVHECCERMYEGYFRDRDRLPPGSLVEIRFEELVADPVATMRSVYESAGLGDFENMVPALEAFWEERKSHRANRIRINDEIREQIDRRWSRYMDEYGYEAGRQADSANSAIATEQVGK